VRLPILFVLASLPLAACGGATDGLTNNGADPPWVVQPTGASENLIAVGPGVGVPAADLYAETDATPPNAPAYRYDGKAWARVFPTFKTCLTCKSPQLIEVGGVSLAAGVGGAVNRLNPSTMTWVAEPTGLTTTVFALWGSDPSNIFAVGENGGIARFDGKAWTVQKSPVTQSLRAVFGADPNHVVAVGDRGTIVRYDGKAWVQDQLGVPGSNLRDVWGSTPLGFFAVGEAGLILQRSAM
jgi:photosystem II stability/assembly factor-like uncharacterized protein